MEQILDPLCSGSRLWRTPAYWESNFIILETGQPTVMDFCSVPEADTRIFKSNVSDAAIADIGLPKMLAPYPTFTPVA